MSILMLIVGLAAGVFGGVLFTAAKYSTHETEGLVLISIAATCLVGCAILEAIGQLAGRLSVVEQSFGSPQDEEIPAGPVDPAGKRPCPHCGTQIRNNFKMCPHCDQEVRDLTQA